MWLMTTEQRFQSLPWIPESVSQSPERSPKIRNQPCVIAKISPSLPQLGSMQQHAPEGRILCPHCGETLSEHEIRSILGQFGRAKWKKPQVSRFAKMTPEEPSGRSHPDTTQSPLEARGTSPAQISRTTSGGLQTQECVARRRPTLCV
jgi:hypothetical protein